MKQYNLTEAEWIRFKQHIIDSEMAKGKSRADAERIAYATASAHGWRRSSTTKQHSVAPIPTALRRK